MGVRFSDFPQTKIEKFICINKRSNKTKILNFLAPLIKILIFIFNGLKHFESKRKQKKM